MCIVENTNKTGYHVKCLLFSIIHLHKLNSHTYVLEHFLITNRRNPGTTLPPFLNTCFPPIEGTLNWSHAGGGDWCLFDSLVNGNNEFSLFCLKWLYIFVYFFGSNSYAFVKVKSLFICFVFLELICYRQLLNGLVQVGWAYTF